MNAQPVLARPLNRAAGLPGLRGSCGSCGAAGFGLVELAVVLALLALLVAAAWPSWQSHLQHNRRLDATGALMRVQRAQASHHQNFGLYATTLSQLRDRSGSIGDTSRAGHYRLSLQADGPQNYLAVAEAQAGQAADSDCVRIVLSVRGLVSEQQPSERCWLP